MTLFNSAVLQPALNSIGFHTSGARYFLAAENIFLAEIDKFMTKQSSLLYLLLYATNYNAKNFPKPSERFPNF